MLAQETNGLELFCHDCGLFGKTLMTNGIARNIRLDVAVQARGHEVLKDSRVGVLLRHVSVSVVFSQNRAIYFY